MRGKRPESASGWAGAGLPEVSGTGAEAPPRAVEAAVASSSVQCAEPIEQIGPHLLRAGFGDAGSRSLASSFADWIQARLRPM